MLSTGEIYVYFHIPFCRRRCIYCDFVSSTSHNLVEDYFESLEMDLKMALGTLGRRSVKTIYFGGGTPSLVDSRYIGRLIRFVENISGMFEPLEVTLEANPESFGKDKARDYVRMGVNRLSLGIQAADDGVLEMSGRSHDLKMAEKAAGIAAEYFDNYNFDFVIGLPGYDMEVVEKNLKFVERFKPTHVSVYMLEVHEETPLFALIESGKIALPDPDERAEMLDFMKDGLIGMGYRWYELSNYAMEGKESVHNTAYWLNEDYLGFGVSAGGHVGRYRYVKTLNLREYIKDPSSLSYERENDDCQEFKETLFMGLRLIDGVEKERLVGFSGTFEKFYEDFKDDELFEIGDRIRLSVKGLNFSVEAFERIVGWDCGN